MQSANCHLTHQGTLYCRKPQDTLIRNALRGENWPGRLEIAQPLQSFVPRVVTLQPSSPTSQGRRKQESLEEQDPRNRISQDALELHSSLSIDLDSQRKWECKVYGSSLPHSRDQTSLNRGGFDLCRRWKSSPNYPRQLFPPIKQILLLGLG